MEHIEETGRNFGDMYKEHLTAFSPIFDHCQTIGHSIKQDNFSMVDSESQSIARSIKEAMYIHFNDPL